MQLVAQPWTTLWYLIVANGVSDRCRSSLGPNRLNICAMFAASPPPQEIMP